MNVQGWLVCWAMIVVGMCGSALYSGLEMGAYNLNRVRLHIFRHQGRRSAVILGRLVESPVTLLGVLLIGNNVTNYLGTAGVTLLLERLGLDDWQVVAANVLLVTPVLLVFGEVLPKDLFAAHSDALMYRFARFLSFSRWVFACTGLLGIVRVVGGGGGKESGRMPSLHPRKQVALMVREGAGNGLLSEEQIAIADRVLTLNERTVGGEMVPWARVATVRWDATPQGIWERADRTSHSRLPVLGPDGGVVGVLSVVDVLLQGRDRCPSISELMSKPATMDVATSLRDGMRDLQTARMPLAIVTDGGRPVGVVTIKDLIEPITGELASW